MTWWKLFANQIILRKSELGSCVLEGSITSKMHNVTMFQQTIVRWFSGTLTNCNLWRRPVSFSKAINDWTECPSVKHERSLVEFVVQFEVGGFLMYYVLFSNIWSWYPYRKDAICVFWFRLKPLPGFQVLCPQSGWTSEWCFLKQPLGWVLPVAMHRAEGSPKETESTK